MSEKRPTAFIPEMCQMHQSALVGRLQIGPKGPWRVAIVIVQVLLFQAATSTDTVWQRCSLLPSGERDANDLSLVLAEIGCLACFRQKMFNRAVNIMKRKGLRHAALLSQGKVNDPSWPVKLAS